jgi:hypothetical protein
MSTWCKLVQSHWKILNPNLLQKQEHRFAEVPGKIPQPRTRKYTSLRTLSCSCSSGWPFKYKRSNANKQTWTLIVFSDTPFLALVLRICIQIMSFQISSTLVITFIVFHLLPTLEACCMKLPVAWNCHVKASTTNQGQNLESQFVAWQGKPILSKKLTWSWMSISDHWKSVCLSLSKSLTRFSKNQI